ncbi:sensor histidine kinase [Aureimonas psammosilenae]|uniref:sensor histidine kinase n=1 Tax=Aureimonas psammosilenae TaxID=2495496 RepID=UPI00186A5D6F|nr:HAMP domain-containing sensor histidine kinase [Aureimonas psammosilenae]
MLRRRLLPSITQRVFLVGAIPILAAVLIGAASLFLLNRADDARRGALTVATEFRQIVTAIAERDAFVHARPSERERHRTQFIGSLDAALDNSRDLLDFMEGTDNRETILGVEFLLQRFRAAMGELEITIERNDKLVATMRAHLDSLLALTDAARKRQHESNANIVATLRRNDDALRGVQDLVRRSELARAAITDRQLGGAGAPDGGADDIASVRVNNAVDDLRTALKGGGEPALADGFDAMLRIYADGRDVNVPLAWLDQRIKIDGTAARALQEKVAELLAYTVEAHETEQATQNIAVETMRLTSRTGEAIASRNVSGIAAAVADSRTLSERIATLPISPLIQTDMLDALDIWRASLGETSQGLAKQNAILADMADMSNALVFDVAHLNRELARNADDIGAAARRMLGLGAFSGLLAGAVFALLVARSITTPLKHLERDMLDRTFNPEAGPLAGSARSDEIGHMAEATNRFLFELNKREGALRREKERTEETLRELRRTQRELIQSEKLASLGQLVAGVAHEINTPLGIALTTATVMRDELQSFSQGVGEGRVSRAAFDRFVERLRDGIRLTTANLERSAQLVVSFKQVAADRASGERRKFDLKGFLDDLFISLRPLGKRFGHTILVECGEGIEMDSYPGALAQVLTNLVTNAYNHAFEATGGGTIRIEAARSDGDRVTLLFRDDGRGIDPANRTRIFDPFFTTGRAQGSTGLGLHIVFSLVTGTLGGTIEVESAPGEGTCFAIQLPRRRVHPVQAAVAPGTAVAAAPSLM